MILDCFRFDFICAPICHPRYKREFIDPIPERSKAFTRADLVLTSQGKEYTVILRHTASLEKLGGDGGYKTTRDQEK